MPMPIVPIVPMMMTPSSTCVCAVPMEVLSVDVPFSQDAASNFEFELRHEAGDFRMASYGMP